MTDLEARIRRLEDIESIRRLKFRYAELCDDNYNPSGLAMLFTEDGVWDGGEDYGVHTGKEQIASYWQNCADSIPFAMHMIINHSVDVSASGDLATGACSLFQPMTLNGEPHWAGVRYDEEYARVDGDWKFRRIALTTLMLAPHADGW